MSDIKSLITAGQKFKTTSKQLMSSLKILNNANFCTPAYFILNEYYNIYKGLYCRVGLGSCLADGVKNGVTSTHDVYDDSSLSHT